MNDAGARLGFDRIACLRGTRLLFEDLSFALDAGQAAIVTGPNGIGKSSLLRIAAGLLDPTAGRIDRRGRIALVNEAAALDPQSSLGKALDFWARIDGRTPADVATGLAAMDIAALAEVPVRMLSTGQRRRAALARTIASGADIWLLDEPGNGLDAASLERLDAAMAAHRTAGGIVLATSHQPLGLTDAISIRLAGAASPVGAAA